MFIHAAIRTSDGDSHSVTSLRVEFLGSPGVGKTTLTRAVSTQLEATGHRCHCPSARIDGYSRPHRIARKALIAFERAAREPTQTISDVRTLENTDQQRHIDLLRVAFNWQFVCALGHQTRPGITLADQGIFQALWSVGWGASSWESIRAVTVPENLLPDLLVVLTAESSVIRERLTAREGGDTRVTSEDVTRAVEGVDRVRELASEYERALGRPTVVTIDTTEPGPTEAVIAEVVAAIEACQC